MMAVLAVAMLAAGAAAAGAECASCVRIPADQLDLYREGVPLSIWTDSAFYDRGSVMTVEGHLRPENAGHPVIITVASASGNVVEVAQVEPGPDGSFSAEFDPSGPLWTSEGAYVVTARSGPDSRVFRTQVEIIPYELGAPGSCGPSQISVSADNGGTYCVDYRATGEVTGIDGFLSIADRLLSLEVRGPGAGTLWLEIPRSLLDSQDAGGRDTPFGVFVGGGPAEHSEEDPTDLARTLRIPYGPDLRGSIEVAGTSAVPEFGAVAAVAAAGAAAAAGAGRLRLSKQ